MSRIIIDNRSSSSDAVVLRIAQEVVEARERTGQWPYQTLWHRAVPTIQATVWVNSRSHRILFEDFG